MKPGYFQTETSRPGIDNDTLDTHQEPTETIMLDAEALGPLKPYFERLSREAHECYQVAAQARATGIDPETEPEIPFAEDLASRVEALVGPDGVAERIRELKDQMGREDLALTISKEVAEGRFGEYDAPEDALDGAIRTGLAILTEGILVAPLEGVAQVKIRENNDGTRYADVYFAGPIRAAGGTGQALSVLIADVVRRELGLDAYQATRGEVERFKEEIPAYKKAANLQYTPSADEIERIVPNLPIGINGEGTEQEEVSGQRDLPRVETNQLRGGACLVLAEGLTLKAPKILKHVDALNLEGWEFLEDYLTKDKPDDTHDTDDEDGKTKIQPVDTFIQELTAGRPVFSHPSTPGGFRLRYGRSRGAGLAATAIHPALCGLVDDFLAVGTQLKTERPGKGTLVTPCEALEPPLVRLTNGTVQEVHTYDEATQIRTDVEQILDLGEMLVPYGEFLENNKPLAPASWCPEWWTTLLEHQDIQPPAVPDDAAQAAYRFAQRTHTPLHPRFTLFWHDITHDELNRLIKTIPNARWENNQLHLPHDEDTKTILETLGATHTLEPQPDPTRIVLDERTSLPVLRGTGHRIKNGEIQGPEATPDGADAEILDTVQRLSGVQLKPKAPTRIGARMGRPEKAAERQMSPPVHGLFPLGGAGGLQRLIRDAAQKGEIGSTDPRSYDAIEAGTRVCPDCHETTLHLDCPDCTTRTQPLHDAPEAQTIPLKSLVDAALNRLAEGKLDPNTKGVQGLISETKLPEPIEKAILRAKRDVWVFKDGTCRYDMTDLPLTQFRPAEINTPVDKLKTLGYTHDVDGHELTDPNQLLELKPQDVVIHDDALDYLARVAQFVDDELTRLYGIEPYYNLDEASDLIGHLAVGLAPHTSGGVLCRIIGTTKAAGHWAHPYFHAAKRRNCVHPDTEIRALTDQGSERKRIEDVYEAADGPSRFVDDVGTQAKQPSQPLQVIAADPQTGETEIKPVSKLYRAPAPDHLVKIQTQSGRTLTATPDHRMQVPTPSGIEKRRVRDLEEGTPLAFAQTISSPAPEDDAIDLLRELDPAQVEDVMVRGLGSYLEKLITSHGGLKAAAQAADTSMKALDNYRRRDSIPLDILTPLVENLGIRLTDLPTHLHLAAKRDNVNLPRLIPFSPALGRLVGYYLSEGHARAEPGQRYQASIAATEKELVTDVQECADAALGLSPTYDGKSITLSGRLVHHLFTDILDLGSGAHSKQIPSRIANLPDDVTSQVLAAYFAGDGSVERGRLHVTCDSANPGLLRDIGYELTKRGIKFRLSESKREAGGAARDFYDANRDETPTFQSYRLSIRSDQALKFLDKIGFALHRKQDDLEAIRDKARTSRFKEGPGDLIQDPIKTIEPIPFEGDWVYDLEVEDHHNYFVNDFLLSSNCDGDEDCLMLLMDGLVNFSRWYLPDRRGGQMDAPLTLSIRVDPEEIDSEAHNLDVAGEYPLAFYEATERVEDAKAVTGLMETVEDRLGQDTQYDGMLCTHDTPQIDAGPRLSAYKTIDSMMEKMEGQLALADRIRAVDAGDVASRVICDHFLPDIQGNLNAFTRQTVRCAKCNAKYRRVPLSGRCTKCKNQLTMTVHEASVKKYVDISKRVAENYDVDAYTQQRLALIENALESLFENDKVKKAKLSDFL